MANLNNPTRKDTWMLKAPKVLKEKLDNVRIARIKSGLDRQTTPYRRLLLAMSRHEKMMDDLSKANLVDDKKGQMQFNIFTFMVVGFLAVVLLAGMIYVQGLLYGTFHDIGIQYDQQTDPTSSGYVNMTAAADTTWGVVNDSIQSLRLYAAMWLLGMAVCIIITNALMKTHPIWFFAYILISILSIIFAVPVSNAYESLLSSNLFGGQIATFTVANWIFLNLPMFVLVVSVFGGIFLFINLIRTQEIGSLP